MQEKNKPQADSADIADIADIAELPPQENFKLSLSVQYPDLRLRSRLPRNVLRHWVRSAMQGPANLTLRVVNQEESQKLNREYRGKDYPTNVLTFPYSESTDEVAHADIVLCSEVLAREAREQGKTLEQHACHLVVHGVLHAHGYDHEHEDDAQEMEQLETQILARLGIADPYLIRE
jgi:probable rRNA maturation factor